MPHRHDPDDTLVIVDSVDDAVVPYANPPEVMRLAQLATARWPGFGGETPDPREDPPHLVRR